MTQEQLANLVVGVVVMVLSLSFHEAAHAFVAHWLGDDTAKERGRLTLNPISHIDPIGTLLMPAIGAWTGMPLLAWAVPCPTDPRRYTRVIAGKRVTMAFGHTLVAVAGPLSNLFLALVLSVLLGLFMRAQGDMAGPAGKLLQDLMWMNVGLFVFNLLPVPPLDGSRVAAFLMPRRFLQYYDQLGGMTGMLILMALVSTGATSSVMRPVMRAAWTLVRTIARV